MPALTRFHKLRLATRASLLFAGGLALMVGVCLFAFSLFFLKSVHRIELDHLAVGSHQANEAIALRQQQLAARSVDWGWWDETWTLLQKGDPDFAERNLNVESMHANGVDLMLFIRRDGSLADSALIDRQQTHLQPFTDDLWRALHHPHRLGQQLAALQANPDQRRQPLSGLISLENTPWLVVLTPVLKSDLHGPIAGWMLWGLRLASFFPSQYAQILSADTFLRPSTESPANRPGYQPLSSRFEQIELWSDGRSISAFSELQDINGSHIARIEVNAPRQLYDTAKLTLGLLTAISLACGILLCWGFLRLFQRYIAARFNTLEQGLLALARGNWDIHLPVEGHDEITLASRVINQLVTSRQTSRLELGDIEQKFFALYENSPLGILMVDQGVLMNMNNQARQLLHYDGPAVPVGTSLDKLFPPASPLEPFAPNRFWKLVALGQRLIEWELLTLQGRRLPCEIHLIPLAHTGGSSWLLSLRDLTAQRDTELQIHQLSHYDSLTGLFNRTQLLSRLQHDLDQRQPEQAPFALLHIDLVQFKAINDTFGHDAGDRVLRELGHRLSSAAPRQVLARIGADEFVLYIPQMTTLHQARHIARELHALLARPLHFGNAELELRICIGVVMGSSHFTLADDVLRCADYALNIAKRQRQGTILFTQRLYQVAMEEMIIKRDLPQAIRQDHLMTWFQPIVDADQDQVTSLEALVRWQHPELGFIPPGRFVPIAEADHLVLELGEKVLQMACRAGVSLNQCRTNRGLPPLLIHVNLSARHFGSPTLIPLLEETLRQTGMPASQLALEITETTLLESPREAIRRMHTIRQMGIHLALDDFGTGYSALNTLSDYPIDVVKLDRSFMLRLTAGPQGELLVRAIINMARDLGMEVIAEGVETEAQRDKLLALGIREIQGWLYYRPMSIEALREMNAC